MRTGFPSSESNEIGLTFMLGVRVERMEVFSRIRAAARSYQQISAGKGTLLALSVALTAPTHSTRQAGGMMAGENCFRASPLVESCSDSANLVRV
jgi:hypothetical protein